MGEFLCLFRPSPIIQEHRGRGDRWAAHNLQNVSFGRRKQNYTHLQHSTGTAGWWMHWHSESLQQVLAAQSICLAPSIVESDFLWVRLRFVHDFWPMINFVSLFQDVLLDFTVQFLIEQGCQCQKKLPFPLPSPVKALISCHTTLTIVLIGSRKRAKSFVTGFWDTPLNHDNFVR